MPNTDTVYARLGGYDSVAAIAGDLIDRLMADPLLSRFWDNRGDDGLEREKQLLINFFCHELGGPVLYLGRDMHTAHKGMHISEADWEALSACSATTLDKFDVQGDDRAAIIGLVESHRAEIIEA